MDIPKDEYEKKRSLFEVCEWINEKLFEMKAYPNFDEIYFERKGKNVKKLLEEAIPISYLGLYFHKAWDKIAITCLTGNQPFDAEIEITNGFGNKRILKIEVSTTETTKSTMIRQALSRNHFAFLTGNITREGRNIIIDPEIVDVDEEEEKIIDLAFERCLNKINHGYTKETAILVYVDFYRKLSIRSRNTLIERTRLFIYDNDIDIYGIYYCYSADYGVDGIQKDSSIR